MFGEYNRVFDEFTEKVNRVKYYNGYKYLFGKNAGLEKRAFREIEAPLFKDGFLWPFGENNVWFKGELVIPAEIAGVPLAGSKVTLDYRAAVPSEVFIDGEKVIDAKWWINKDIILTDDLKKQESFEISIHHKKNDGFASISSSVFYIDKLEAALLKIDSFLKSLVFIAKLIELHEINDDALISCFENILKNVPIQLLAEEKTPEFIAYIEHEETKMQVFSPYMKKYCSYLVGHSHLDMNWLWDWENTVDTAKRSFLQADKLMTDYPDFCFSQSQAAHYQVIERHYPDLFEKIRKRIEEGRWDVSTASTWVEGDLNMSSGEALVRQSLLAKQYMRSRFNAEPCVCWCPDTFGHSFNYPQILKKCGIDYYYYCRTGAPAPIFYWEGIDGSKVLAFNDPKGYNGIVSSKLAQTFDHSLIEHLPPTAGYFADLHEKYHIHKHLFAYGVGDHGGGPTRRDINNALKLKDKAVFTEVKFSSASQFFKDVERDMKDIPVMKNELNYVFEGCYTTHADIKKYNRECENLLVSAETFASIASLSGFAYPHKELNDAWEKTCFNQFHDIMDGSAIHSSYEYSKDLAESALSTARQAQQEALAHISSRVAFPKQNGGTPLVIFNPLAWERSETAKISLSGLNISNPAVEDISGRKIPAQIVGNELFFHAENVPSMGYKSYFLKEGQAEALPGEKSDPETKTVFENEKYLLEMDPDFGGIKRLFDKEKRKELIDDLQQGNIFRLYTEVEHGMSAWNIGATASVKNLYRHTTFTKVERGPLADIIETECKFSKSLLKQQIIFFKECGKIEFRTELSWNETGNPQDGIPMLRVSFPLKINPEKIVREIPFGAFEHPCNGQEVPALKWIDCSDSENGVALLNDCKYGFNARGSDMELTIVRSPYSPDLNPDCGEHSFSYCLCPHDGDWRDADIVKKGYEFNMPLLAVIPRGLAEGEENLPSEKSFVKPGGTDSVIISCLKKAEDGNGLIMHAYESKGKSAAPEINFGMNIAAVRETNLIEDETGSGEFTGSKLRDKFGEWEIKSYRLIPE